VVGYYSEETLGDSILGRYMADQERGQSIPQLRQLRAEEVLNIQAVCLNFPYNFAQPPTPELHWALSDLIDHSRFPMAMLDATDKWGIQFFALENFLKLIDPHRISEPGYISPHTIAKLVSYSLQIVESTAESIVALKRLETFNGDDLFAQIQRLADEALIDDELSPWRHFWIATRHPTVRWAINNAVINRWGALGCEFKVNRSPFSQSAVPKRFGP